MSKFYCLIFLKAYLFGLEGNSFLLHISNKIYVKVLYKHNIWQQKYAAIIFSIRIKIAYCKYYAKFPSYICIYIGGSISFMEKLASFDVDVYRGIRHLLGFCITAQCSIIGKKIVQKEIYLDHSR